MYGDDKVLIGKTIIQLQRKIFQEKACKKYGMKVKVNLDKTKVMAFRNGKTARKES